jgi:hypothetical protein
VLVEPEREAVLGGAGDEGCAFARREPLLRLSRELRLAQLHRQHVSERLPHVLRRDAHAARNEIAELAELADRFRDADAQSADVRAALRRRNEVHVALGESLVGLGEPQQRPLRRLALSFDAADHGLLREARRFRAVEQVLREPVLVAPLFFLARLLDAEVHAQSRAQHRFGAQQVLEARERE